MARAAACELVRRHISCVTADDRAGHQKIENFAHLVLYPLLKDMNRLVSRRYFGDKYPIDRAKHSMSATVLRQIQRWAYLEIDSARNRHFTPSNGSGYSDETAR